MTDRTYNRTYNGSKFLSALGNDTMKLSHRKSLVNTYEDRLKENKIDLTLDDVDGQTALIITCRDENFNYLTPLIIRNMYNENNENKKQFLGHVDNRGYTALMYLSNFYYFKDFKENVKLLYYTGYSDPEYLDKDGETVLHIVYNGYNNSKSQAELPEDEQDADIIDSQESYRELLVLFIHHFYFFYFDSYVKMNESIKDENLNSIYMLLKRICFEQSNDTQLINELKKKKIDIESVCLKQAEAKALPKKIQTGSRVKNGNKTARKGPNRRKSIPIGFINDIEEIPEAKTYESLYNEKYNHLSIDELAKKLKQDEDSGKITSEESDILFRIGAVPNISVGIGEFQEKPTSGGKNIKGNRVTKKRKRSKK